jgi:aspartate 1-decarboxylase
MCKAKIHRATVTEANLNYVGSITIDDNLLEAANILPYELVQITNVQNGTIWRTYVIAAEAGSGTIALNGPPARHFQPGDEVIILSHGLFSGEELQQLKPTILFVNDSNELVEVRNDEDPFEKWPAEE